MRLDLIGSAHDRHLLAVGLRSPRVIVGGDGRGVGRLAQGDALAVGAQHHDLLAGRRHGCRPGGFVAGHRPGQGPGHRLQTGHGLLQAQDARQDRVDLAVGILHRQRLIPVLQEIGKRALGQPQPGIQRRRLDRLAFPRAVDHPRQGEVAKDRPIGSVMTGGQALDHPPVGQGQALTAVPVTGQGEIGRLQVVTQLQQARPQAALQFVRRQPVAHRRLDQPGQRRPVRRQV